MTMTDEPCSCPFVKVGRLTTSTRAWNEFCVAHGVGSEYFRTLKELPFGYAHERETSREEWLRACREEQLRAQDDEQALTRGTCCHMIESISTGTRAERRRSALG